MTVDAYRCVSNVPLVLTVWLWPQIVNLSPTPGTTVLLVAEQGVLQSPSSAEAQKRRIASCDVPVPAEVAAGDGDDGERDVGDPDADGHSPAAKRPKSAES